MLPRAIFRTATIVLGSSLIPVAETSSAPPPWRGNRAGIGDELLPPCTPITVAGDSVGVWGRTYQFGALPLLTSAAARDAEILAGPVSLAGTADGKPLAWRGAACRVVEAQPHMVRLSATAEADVLCCAGEVCIEYDGMVRCDFRLEPKNGKATVERLALELLRAIWNDVARQN